MKRVLMIFFLCLFSVATIYAQIGEKRTVTGKVKDLEGVGLPGVSVVIKGTTSGTVTDMDGVYSIPYFEENAVLVFSFIGMQTQEVPIENMAEIDIVLLEENKGLDEVVVVGYGSQTRSKLTSSISTVKSEKLKQSSVANLENALGGRMSGVFSRQVSGEPGNDGAKIRIRGFGDALIVVDGVPGRDYSQLDPNEIESISVLKDAASAAVYGMQGANGVILVTTKKGYSGAPVVEVNSHYGVQTPTRFPKAMNGIDWQLIQKRFAANNQLQNNPNAIIPADQMAIDKSLPSTNWYKNSINEYSPIMQTNVNISGGTNNIKYYFLVGYLNQQGIWKSNDTNKNRYNVRSNLDIKVNDQLSIQGGIGGVLTKLKYPAVGQHRIGENVIFAPPVFAPKTSAGNTFIPVKSVFNPLALMDANVSGYSKDKRREWNINLSANYKVPFIEGLSFKGVLGYDTYDGYVKNWNKAITFHQKTKDGFEKVLSNDEFNKTSLYLTDTTSYNLTIQGFVKYVKSFNNHNIQTSLVYEETHGNSHTFKTGRGTYPSALIDNLSAGMDDDKKFNSESERTFASRSYIGRLSYDFDTKYLVEFVGRYDGAQYFAPGKRWGFFPAVSLGWMISKESFMESSKSFISELKLRASWGQLGDMSAAKKYYNENDDYYWKEGYKYPGDVLQVGNDKIYTLKKRLVANPDFTWSKSITYNVGLDGKMWGRKLSFTSEVFYRKRTDLPAKKADDNAGNLATYYNLNADNTRGFEISLTHDNQVNDFHYNLTANLSWARTQYGYTEQQKFTSGYDKWRNGKDGNWDNSQWGLGVDGRYLNEKEIADGDYLVGHSKKEQLPGDVIYKDWNGDGYIDNKDQHIIGRKSYPEMIYGLTASMEWNGMDLI